MHSYRVSESSNDRILGGELDASSSEIAKRKLFLPEDAKFMLPAIKVSVEFFKNYTCNKNF